EHDVRLDAAAGDGAGELAALAHDELRADGPRRGAPRGDDRRDGDLLPPGAPAVDIRQELFHPADASARGMPSAVPRPRGDGLPALRARAGPSRGRSRDLRSRAR